MVPVADLELQRRATGLEGLVVELTFEPSGDPSVGPVTILVAGKSFEVDREVTPEDELVSAARG